MAALESARITNLPDSAYYIPDFITREEEEKILKKVIAYNPFSQT